MGSTYAGRYNRIAGNDFHENSITAENYISKDLVNITIPQIENEVRLLVPAQRKQLHQLFRSKLKCRFTSADARW